MQFMPKPYQLEYLLGTTAFINNAVTPVNKKTRITKHFHGNIMDNRINNKHKSFISLSVIKSSYAYVVVHAPISKPNQICDCLFLILFAN